MIVMIVLSALSIIAVPVVMILCIKCGCCKVVQKTNSNPVQQGKYMCEKTKIWIGIYWMNSVQRWRSLKNCRI